MSNDLLTNNAGAPVVDNENALTAGPRGPMLLQDTWFLEKLAHFDREVIPERRMHAKGSGAYGTFTVTHDITRYTKASLFSQIGKKTDLFMRFSTVAGERGAADAERDIRGFAIKFYTDQGNWDLVGNNTPVFFLRDPLKFPDLNHVVKRDPRTNMHSAKNNWDFWTLLPEALHQVTVVMSDRGIPASYRHMHGFGSHTFSFINANNERFWVKFHFRTQQGIKNLTDAEAEAIIAKDRESHQRDLYEHIEKGDFPRWTLFIQIMPEADAEKLPYHPFDLTKVWYHKDYPLIEVGELELNRNPENYFAEVEQAAFNPANVVPGISFSPDKMLQGRLFSYGDAQRYRFQHALDALSFLPYGTMVDEFQHRIYAEPDLTPAERNAVWLELEAKYRPYIDQSGIPYLERGTRWQYQMHIYETPFYYIDYCLAQTAAFQFLLASQDDYADAFARYLQLSQQGGEKLWTDLLTEAGFRSPFAPGALAQLAAQVEPLIRRQNI